MTEQYKRFSWFCSNDEHTACCGRFIGFCCDCECHTAQIAKDSQQRFYEMLGA